MNKITVIRTKDGSVIHIAVWDEPEDEGIVVVQCLNCGLRVDLRKRTATEIANDIVTFSLGHPCVQVGKSDAPMTGVHQ